MASPAIEDQSVRVRVAGKINLTLRSGPRRADGYHSLATVFQAVSLFDEIEAAPAEPGEFTVTMHGDQADQVPTGADNLAIRAARLLAKEVDHEDAGVNLVIRKSIPVTGGMAGGSADAAGALLACSVLWDLDITPDELRVFGAQLGADVPFCLAGGTALGTDRGDRLVPVLSRGSYHWVLAFSDRGLSTPAVFGKFDELGCGAGTLEPPEDLLNALVSGDPVALGKALANDLSEAALALRPDLGRVIETGLELGAIGSIISGSGPTVAFLAPNESAAVDLSVALSGSGACHGVRRVTGPVPGARLLG
ncbi:4-diphosphocytidyl-2-C-methyl-D-erythritol kinase [Propionicimonas paludicola]|uniref:4-diphosphocytidyl-2-C-methyl-D-erythritol kinase n=1 Tax=Propionicimonas paludicola TaxID=185243 RepID=A0A2A9CUV3_9ACTN|nr:4-(cytidine 5'-diphospho)-2-C-methyl-D-erythritol kinase [Propionicimonas paludicola]PFG17400.1 4-diphosphocytidyl-2-C-methyl-D-erythritol kinase [Propionicimonas paludicola]